MSTFVILKSFNTFWELSTFWKLLTFWPVVYGYFDGNQWQVRHAITVLGHSSLLWFTPNVYTDRYLQITGLYNSDNLITGHDIQGEKGRVSYHSYLIRCENDMPQRWYWYSLNCATFRDLSWSTYSTEGILINFIGLSIILVLFYTLYILYMVPKTIFASPKPGEEPREDAPFAPLEQTEAANPADRFSPIDSTLSPDPWL